MTREVIVKGDSIPDEYVREAVDKLHGILTNLRTRLDRASNGAHAAPERHKPKEPPLDYCAAWDNNRGAICGNDLPCANHPAGPAQAREEPMLIARCRKGGVHAASFELDQVAEDAAAWLGMGLTVTVEPQQRVGVTCDCFKDTCIYCGRRQGSEHAGSAHLFTPAAPTADRAAPAGATGEKPWPFKTGRIRQAINAGKYPESGPPAAPAPAPAQDRAWMCDDWNHYFAEGAPSCNCGARLVPAPDTADRTGDTVSVELPLDLAISLVSGTTYPDDHRVLVDLLDQALRARKAERERAALAQEARDGS